MDKRSVQKTGKVRQGKQKPIVFRTNFDPNYKGSPGEYNEEASETIPDQSMTIQEMLENHVRGIANPVAENAGEYFDSEIPRHEDMVNEMEYKQELKKRYEEAEKTVQEELSKEKTNKEKKEKALADLVEKRILEEQADLEISKRRLSKPSKSQPQPQSG